MDITDMHTPNVGIAHLYFHMLREPSRDLKSAADAVLTWLTCRAWSWMWYVTPKRETHSQLYSVTTVNTIYIDMRALHMWSWTILGKPPVVQPLNKFPVFYGTLRFIIAFTRAIRWFWSLGRPIQSIPPHSLSPRSTWILSTHLRERFVFPRGLFPSRLRTNNIYEFLVF